jgi:hypothetical protein
MELEVSTVLMLRIQVLQVVTLHSKGTDSKEHAAFLHLLVLTCHPKDPQSSNFISFFILNALLKVSFDQG